MNNGEEAFIRKGKNGSWKEEFSKQIKRSEDKWIKEKMKSKDLRLKK
jgi:hypothetical protein